ncbi:MAG: site-specific integrase, partial [Bacteroidales bacterium]|nr:site-specific integrase [Bacteroidales bacterium]
LDEPHRPLNVNGTEIVIRTIGKEAGIPCHPHMLRHSFASHLVEQGVPLSITPCSSIGTGHSASMRLPLSHSSAATIMQGAMSSSITAKTGYSV